MGFRPSRYLALVLCVLLIPAGLGLVAIHRTDAGVVLAVLGAALTLLGAYDLLQRRHSIQRNYPVIGHIRWMPSSSAPRSAST